MKPQNFEEKVVWYYINGTYGLYFLGLQYMVAPLIAIGLSLYLLKKLWNQTEDTPPEERITIPIGVWVWIIAMIFMEVAIIGSNLHFGLGLDRIIKTTTNVFIRRWLLFALFPLIGCLKIRPQLIYRAVCILCLQSLVFIFISYIGEQIGVGDRGFLYTSPVPKMGAGDIFFKVFLYPYSTKRLYLFTPWAPALGLVGSVFFFMTMAESDKKWKWIGMIGAAAMAWTSGSRTATLCLFGVPFVSWFLASVARPSVLVAAGIGSALAGVMGPQLLIWAQDYKESFEKSRADSTRVRAALRDLTLYRWKNEAMIWGIGTSEGKGPKVVEHMPVGSHHHWAGLLFLHGIVGFTAFTVATVWTFIEMLIKAQKSRVAQTGLSVFLVLLVYSFAENLEALAYLIWPALILLGIGFKEKFPSLESLIGDRNYSATSQS